jgi:beta-glucanase (GH16 family)
MEITLTQEPIHGLNFSGGLVSTWNKFCFTGGLIEVSVTLPGSNNIHGLWPAVWALGNLGRAGYGASLDGMVRSRICWLNWVSAYSYAVAVLL